MNIRNAISSEDFESVYQLNVEFAKFYKAGDKFTLTKEQLYADKDLFQCRVAEIDGKIVGFTTFFPAYYTWVGKSLYLDDLFVSSSFRGKSIGEKLLEDVIQIAKNQGCNRLVWQVSDWNKGAQKFYKEKGAELVEGEINCVYRLKMR